MHIVIILNFLTYYLSSVFYYVPLWYKKSTDLIIPYTTNVYNIAIEYSTNAWKETKPYIKKFELYCYELIDNVMN